MVAMPETKHTLKVEGTKSLGFSELGRSNTYFTPGLILLLSAALSQLDAMGLTTVTYTNDIWSADEAIVC